VAQQLSIPRRWHHTPASDLRSHVQRGHLLATSSLELHEETNFGTPFSIKAVVRFLAHPGNIAHSADLMTYDPPKSTISSRAECSAHWFIRRLTNRYFLVLAAVAGLVVIDQAIVQPLLVRMNAYAPAINLAGRQRMLSQKLTKAALKWQAAQDDHSRSRASEELGATLDQWTSAHSALQYGDLAIGIPKLNVPAIQLAWTELQPQFEAMRAAASAILESDSLVATNVAQPKYTSNAAAGSVATIVDHEAQYLLAMDRVVKLLEQEAGQQISLLRVCGVTIAAGVIALLIGLGWFVVRPATHAIRGQVDDLELRVAARTRELADANVALENEIAERAQTETKMQLLANQLAHAGRVSTMGHLTSGLAHELNQPLAAIVNYAETCDLLLSMDNGVREENLVRHIEQIKEAGTRAGQIVRRMRDFVRPNSRSILEIDLNALVREVAELCKFEADRADVQLSLNLSPPGSRVHVDPIQIQQVLVNLVQNALQAMQSVPSNERRMDISTMVCSDSVTVEVTDTGPGLDAVDEQVIFSPFYTTKPDGLGIGLAICRSIVERHAGKVFAQNAPQGGATIGFTLPILLGNETREANTEASGLQSIPCEPC
jgi:two-component system, LuxR family, sensor kinase FixL